MAPSAEPYDDNDAPSHELLALLNDPQVKLHHFNLLRQIGGAQASQLGHLANSPLFTLAALQQLQGSSQLTVSQYGLLAEILDETKVSMRPTRASTALSDFRLFYNTTVPSSTFICGSHGSGKSHTLSCLLENCLVASDAATLPRPLTALVFHYDTFVSDDVGSPCEAACLASMSGIQVRVLCSPTNWATITRTYQHMGVHVEALQIDSRNLNTKRMLDLMAVNQEDGTVPLYVHVAYRVLREMRMLQQQTGERFNYELFKTKLLSSELTPAQLGPLQQRLTVLESFMPSQTSKKMREKNSSQACGTDWTHEPGLLTIIDLSCPCVTPEAACSLFNTCLAIFLERDTPCGRVIALDEAHKRHVGARIVVATQEPTISSALLDLCSVTIIHRFTSPAWLRTVQAHVALPVHNQATTRCRDRPSLDQTLSDREELFGEIVGLKTGEALVFAPSAAVGIDSNGGDGCEQSSTLDQACLKVRIRARLSEDGGKSVLAR
ncbi:uncharacterized protein PG998_014762 [Apiospora kogelbergensis]|uniref:uncharacterized protein n=1 Tax=Apiospora kogelbergensis TaxID=1337665 RepID=UPI003130A3EB